MGVKAFEPSLSVFLGIFDTWRGGVSLVGVFNPHRCGSNVGVKRGLPPHSKLLFLLKNLLECGSMLGLVLYLYVK